MSKTIHHDEEDELVFTKPAEVVSAWLKDVIQPTGLEEGFQETSFTPDDPNEEAWIGVNDEARSSSEYEKEDEREYW